MNIIAALSSDGDAFFTVNQGYNTTLTLKLFLSKLLPLLQAKYPDWRSRIVIVLDNATYHKSKDMLEFFDNQKIPVMFLGPYQFSLAPVEKFFNIIKSQDLNPHHVSLQTQ